MCASEWGFLTIMVNRPAMGQPPTEGRHVTGLAGPRPNTPLQPTSGASDLRWFDRIVSAARG